MSYRDMNSPDLLKTLGTDGQKWAEAFCDIYEHSDNDISVDWLTTWFANAIEAGRGPSK